MKTQLTLEEIGQLALAVLGLYVQPIVISWWLWPILFLAPDLSMLGYLAGPKAGAVFYNLAHHKGVAALLVAAGYLLASPVLLFSGILLYAHSACDRAMGYGLKYPDSFQHTHLGMAGKARA